MGLRILYGVNGEGLGHATRSQVVAEALLARHDVRVVTSGGALAYLRERLPRVEQVFGPSFAMDHGEIRRWATVRHNLATAPRELPVTVRHWLATVDEWRPEVVVTDFEPLAGLYARSAHVPLVSVDNIHMIDRCRHDEGIVGAEHADFAIARAVTRAMVPTAGDYVITTFFRPPVCRGRTTLVETLLRPEISRPARCAASTCSCTPAGSRGCWRRSPRAPLPSRVYGMRELPAAAPEAGRVTFRPRSEEGFLEDLRTARAVITGGGFSLLSEAIALRKPVLVAAAARAVRADDERPLPRARGLRALRRARRRRRVRRFLDAPARVRRRARARAAARQRRGARDDRGGRDAPRRPTTAGSGAHCAGSRGGRSHEAARRRGRRRRRRGRRGRLLRGADPDRPALRPGAVPGARRRGPARAHLRRRAEPRLHALAARAAGPLRRQGDVLPHRPLGGARAGAACASSSTAATRSATTRGTTRRCRAIATTRSARSCGAAGPRSRRPASSSPRSATAALMRPPYGRRRPGTLRVLREQGLPARHVVGDRLRLAVRGRRRSGSAGARCARRAATSSCCTTATTWTRPPTAPGRSRRRASRSSTTRRGACASSRFQSSPRDECRDAAGRGARCGARAGRGRARARRRAGRRARDRRRDPRRASARDRRRRHRHQHARRARARLPVLPRGDGDRPRAHRRGAAAPRRDGVAALARRGLRRGGGPGAGRRRPPRRVRRRRAVHHGLRHAPARAARCGDPPHRAWPQRDGRRRLRGAAADHPDVDRAHRRRRPLDHRGARARLRHRRGALRARGLPDAGRRGSRR